MTYNEWRDELKNNLLTVTDAERRRVLDYYAEAYADRREAGFTEREIIDGFGAPYDAAQRILSESSDDYNQQTAKRDIDADKNRRHHVSREENRGYEREEQWNERQYFAESQEKDSKRTTQSAKNNKRDDNTWLFVLLCIVFAIPIFTVIVAMFGVTVGLCAAPFGVTISGLGTIIAGIGELFHNPLMAVLSFGEGFITVGVGIIAFPLCFKLVKWMWKLFKMFFSWLKRLFSGKENAL